VPSTQGKVSSSQTFCTNKNTSSLAIPQPYNYIVVMNEIHFKWDTSKNETNKKKHGVSFEEAQTAFFDESAMEFFDSEHSNEENRFLLLGQSFSLRTLMICHCHREQESIIRIISARKATVQEQNTYRRNKL
jgi:uncharacterized DUF497 family protein